MNKSQSMHPNRMTAADYQKNFCKLNPKQPGKWGRSPALDALALKRKDCFRSGWEREFALWLTAEGMPWKYESVRLRLADRTTYLPDFWVPWPGQKIEIYEVKGFKRPVAMVKFKVAKEQYPEFKFYLVTKNKLGGWVIS